MTNSAAQSATLRLPHFIGHLLGPSGLALSGLFWNRYRDETFPREGSNPTGRPLSRASTTPGVKSAKRVTQDAIDTIRGRIASGAWGPGTRLPREADLAVQLGLSRSSLREAIRALSVTRVLEVRQGDGTYVGSLEAGDLLEPMRLATDLLRGSVVLELFQIQRLLEPEAAAIAATRHDPELNETLRLELERLYVDGARTNDLLEADTAFHEAIAHAHGNAVMRSLLRSLSTQTIYAHLWRERDRRVALRDARVEHTRIYESIVAGRPDLARAAALIHIAGNESRLRGQLNGNTATEAAARPIPARSARSE